MGLGRYVYGGRDDDGLLEEDYIPAFGDWAETLADIASHPDGIHSGRYDRYVLSGLLHRGWIESEWPILRLRFDVLAPRGNVWATEAGLATAGLLPANDGRI